MRLTREMQSIKDDSAFSSPSPDVLITGIPSSAEISHSEIVFRVLTCLDLVRLHNDILDIRQMLPKRPTYAATTAHSSTTTPPQFISLLVKFKSVDIRSFVIDAKRRRGKITVADIFGETVPELSERTVFVNEFLPSRVYNLHRQARQRAQDFNYSHVWARNGSVFVRKEDNSRPMPIVTADDISDMR